MEKHKDKALADKCLCIGCSHRFECFTQERIFSDPIFQGLFEALMAQGMSKEDALEEVTEELKTRIKLPVDDGSYKYEPLPNPYWAPNTWITNTDWKYYCVDDNDPNITITYHMASGKDVSWSATAW